ncbi:SANT/Myb domain [Dillenia turbinata]|uniref:SANT/Myb domain n=1 Tax=Dillenia turbinata TaxID=194707 RepID=A0AAN8VD34_9MAGN
MKCEMEILSPASSYHSNSNWLFEQRSTKWTHEENKMFENALAVFDKDTPDRWHNVARMIPGKTVGDVIKQYKRLLVDVSNIEAGLVPIPGYNTSTFTLDWVNNHGFDRFKHAYGAPGGKRPSSSGRPSDQERKKGVPWTEEEHKLFLMGLKKYGKGDWRNISRNFVITRTPTQVASHAQKYFIRQLSGGKDKRRASIHDITTVNFTDTRTPSPDTKRHSHSPDQSAPTMLSQHPNSGPIPSSTFHWNQPNNGSSIGFDSMQCNFFTPHHGGIESYGLKMQGHNLHRSLCEPYVGGQNLVFGMHSMQHYPHG